MKKLTSLLLVCLFAVLMVTGCTHSQQPNTVPGAVVEQFSKTFEGVCALWQKVRGKYPKIKEAAVLLREVGGIDDDTWGALVYVDQHAPQLDRWLAMVCDKDTGLANAHIIDAEKNKVDWNAVGSAVLKVTVFAIQQGLL